MRILLSNDDGYQAPGLLALHAAMSSVADVVVVAPDRDRSGASNSLTLEQPIRARTADNGFVRVEGTPTDCVHLAITGLLETEPDMVVSGINAGANMGDDVIARSGMGDELNHVAVDRHTFLSRDYDNVFAIGDAAALPLAPGLADTILAANLIDRLREAGYEVSFTGLNDGVLDCLVVGVEDDKFGQAVTAVVSRTAGSTVDEATIIAEVKQDLAGYKAPKSVIFVDQVPRAPNGKADYKTAKTLASA